MIDESNKDEKIASMRETLKLTKEELKNQKEEEENKNLQSILNLKNNEKETVKNICENIVLKL